MKKMFLLLLALCLLLSGAPVAYATETTEATEASTEETIDPNLCGEGLSWAFEEGVLTISGTGAMDDMTEGAPWEEHKDQITSVVLTGGVTSVGAYAFRNYDSITSVDFGSSLTEIGIQAFEDCDGLTEIRLPATFRRFGKACFQNCGALTEVYCAGGMPSFNANCLWNGKQVTVYCPENNLWPESYVEELETNFGGRLQVLAEDGSDPFDFSEPEEATEKTEAATEETTAATTEAETEPVTEEATVPETQEETLNQETEAPTQEVTETLPEEEKEPLRLPVILAMVIMGLSAVGIIAILVLLKRGKGGKYAG